MVGPRADTFVSAALAIIVFIVSSFAFQGNNRRRGCCPFSNPAGRLGKIEKQAPTASTEYKFNMLTFLLCKKGVLHQEKRSGTRNLLVKISVNSGGLSCDLPPPWLGKSAREQYNLDQHRHRIKQTAHSPCFVGASTGEQRGRLSTECGIGQNVRTEGCSTETQTGASCRLGLRGGGAAACTCLRMAVEQLHLQLRHV